MNIVNIANSPRIKSKKLHQSPEDVYPDDEQILDTRAHSEMKLLSGGSTANSVFLYSPTQKDNQIQATKLIDRIFDFEVKRDALIKARK